MCKLYAAALFVKIFTKVFKLADSFLLAFQLALELLADEIELGDAAAEADDSGLHSVASSCRLIIDQVPLPREAFLGNVSSNAVAKSELG